ncbi:MAG: serine/threonine protein kinase [Planctomycetes bacterium]|nr:serine/threonine protein kinase [Planctomycetota bacterium]
MSEPVDPKIEPIRKIVDSPVSTPTASYVNQNTNAGQVLDSDGIDIESLFAPPEKPGELGRLGHFRILKKLGAGGMGMVLLAEDINLLRPVALKIMLPRHARNEQARERFLREARTAARIHHDHVVTIHHVGQDRDIPFIAMEFLQGAPLDGYLKEKKSVSLAAAMRIGREVAEGLQAAHAKGLIHRDIKPANIWLEAPKGRVKILDFGLARDSGEEAKLTHSGAVIGTPSYMSPEQAAGMEVDQRTDLFSLGVVLFELVTGRLPFTGPHTIAVLKALSFDPHPSISGINPQVSPGLINLVDRLLAKKPEDRPNSAAEVVQAAPRLAATRSLRRVARNPPPHVSE